VSRAKYRKDLTQAETCRIFDQKFDAKLAQDIKMSKPYLTVNDHKMQGHEFISKFFEIESRRQPGEVLGVEKWVSFPIGSSSMGGYIDRLERIGDAIHIIDYKASNYPITQAAADVDWQLAIYEMAIRKEQPEVEKVFLEWFYVGPGVVVRSTRTHHQLRQLHDEICNLIDRIESDREYSPIGNRWCPCEYQDLCDIEKHCRE
jgi:ATP-dependent exoDNAse (exonuclease V) beta subunit